MSESEARRAQPGGVSIWEIDEAERPVEGLDPYGRPRPEYAASLGLIPAPFGRRVLATVYEALVVCVLQLPLLLVTLPALLDTVTGGDPAAVLQRGDLVWVVLAGAFSYALTTAFLLVQLILLGRRGVTLGKAFTGIRVVNVRTLERPKFWRGAVVRYLVMWASFLVVLIGPLLVIALSPLFDSEKRGRGWPDRAAQTWFVDARRGLNPYDAKRMRIARKAVSTDLVDQRNVLPSLATPRSGRGPEVYIPVTRSSSGVLGAARSERTDAPGEPPAIPTVVAPSVAELAAAPAAAQPPAAPAAAPTPAAPPPVVGPPASTPAPAAWQPPQLLPRDPEPAAPSSTRSVSLVLDTGETLDIPDGGALIGRAPTAGPADAGLDLVSVVDASMSVSKTHLAVLVGDEVVVVVDRGSTNGSAVIRGGGEQPLAPGEKVPVTAGDTIRFGDRLAQVRISRR
ncbi:RDD family protein [Microbacterium sp. MC2]